MNKQSKRFYEILEQIKELHDKKRHDYGANEDIFANFRLSELSGIPAWQGSVVRMGDKYARMSNFIKKGEFKFKEENIKLITDEEATKDNIIKGFSDILTQAKEKDRVVVFYAGHGETYKLPTGGYMGYLIPVDGNLDSLITMILFEEAEMKKEAVEVKGVGKFPTDSSSDEWMGE